MKASLPLSLLVAVAMPAGLHAQEIFLKNGSQFTLKNPKREGDKITIEVTGPGGTGSARLGYNVSEIDRAEMPPQPALDSARTLLFAGKPAEAASAIFSAFGDLSPLRGVAGSGWDEAALLYAAALQSSERAKEAIPILEQVVASYPKTSASHHIAAVRLAALRDLQNPDEVVRTADEAIAAKLGSDVVAEANAAAGDALLFNKSYEPAMNRYLKVVVFSPGDRWLGARSLLGAAKAMGALNEKKSCVRALRDIATAYPGTPQAEAARKMLTNGGKEYGLLAVEIDNDEAEAKKRLIEASVQQKPK